MPTKKSLTRAQILRSNGDIQHLFRHGYTTKRGSISVRLCPVPERSGKALFATRRGFKNAVARNKAKRLAREAYRTEADFRLHFYDVGFVLSPGCESRDLSAFSRVLRTALERDQQTDAQ